MDNSYYTYSGGNNEADVAYLKSSMDSLLAFIGIIVIFSIGMYVINSFFLGKIFKKAGVKSWKAWVPVYNIWKILQLGGFHGGLSLLSFVPLANIAALVLSIISLYQITIKMGHEGIMTLVAIFAYPIWAIVLALSKNEWDDSLGDPRTDTPDFSTSPTEEPTSQPIR